MISATGGPGQNGRLLTWNVGTLAAGSQVVDTIAVSVDGTGTLQNVARASSTTPDPAPGNERAVVTTAVDALADLSITKSALPVGPVEAGDTIKYIVTVTNAGPDAASNTSVLDSLPAGVEVERVAGDLTSAVGAFHPAGTRVVGWSGATINAGATTVDTIYVTAQTTGTLTNIVRVDSGTPDPDSNDLRSVWVTTVTGADLAITKIAADDGTPAVGEQITYTLTVTNIGPDPAVGVVVTDTLPAGVSFVSASLPGAETGPGSGVVTWPAFPLTSGASVPLTIVVDINAAEILTNKALVTSDTGDPNLGNNLASAVTTPGASADLSIVKTATDDGTPVVAEQIEYTLTVSNSGPSDVTNVLVTDTLPTGVSFDSASAGGTPAAGIISWAAIPTLAVGADTVVTVWVTITQAATLRNAAAVTSDVGDPVPANNTDTAVTISAASADLSMVKTAVDDGSPVVGEQVTYTLTVTNSGPNAAEGVDITDNLPTDVSFVSASDGGTETAPGSGVVTWPTIASIPVSGSVAYTVLVTIDAEGTLTNTGSVTSTTSDPDAGNNTGTAQTIPGASADLSMAKTGDATATAGLQATYTVTVTNNGPSDANDVVVTDVLPPGTTFSSASDGGAETVLGSGIVTWPAIPTLANLANRAFTVTVDVDPGTLGVVPDTAWVNAATSDPTTGNDTTTFNTTVSASADVSVSKTLPGPITAGGQATYTITVTNNGPSDATAVVVADTLPAEMTYVSAVPGPASASGQTVTWATIGTLAAGDSRVYTVTADIDPGATGSVDNKATAVASTTDATPGNNLFTLNTALQVSADIEVTKTGPSSAVPGNQITYTVTVQNLGPSNASGVVLSDLLPAGVTYVSTNPAGVYDPVGDSVSWNVGTLTVAEGARNFDLVVDIDGGTSGSVVNIANVQSGTPDPVSGNDQAQKITSVSGADLSVTKTAPTGASPGDQITYVVTLENEGPSTAADVVLVDTLPLGVSYFSSTPAGVHNNGQGTVTWNVGTLTVAEGIKTFLVVVDVDPATSGEVINAADATGSTTDPDPSDDVCPDTTMVGEPISGGFEQPNAGCGQ